ncbi:Multiple sugar-binding protein precursor [Bacillus sp. THAF10]|uniref:ABC transporter substrate-binding protein n=1 Tax=Bacillus sp. THAF10 TaxID=2587848 RepID=UPI0012693029|nr:extracellular solute-binding protein [Bacillus sp. THAF10]QFT91051.1 Multiple sugar-binding protein precursor [Bacillus sp. THAF10]
MKGLSKVWLLSLMAIMLVVSSACSNDTGGNNSDGDEVTLTIGSWRTEDTENYKKVIAAFNEKHPDIKVEFKPSKNTEYNTILNTSLQAEEGPDIIHLRPYAPGLELAKAGYIEPIDGLNGLDNFPESTLKASQSADGKQYGVPLNLSTTQVFYNKAIFEEHGIEEPKTWDEFIAINEKLLDEGVTPIALGTKEGWLLSLTHGIFGPAHWGGNAFVDKISKGETDFTSPEFKKSVQAMEDLKKYFPKNSEGLGMEDIRTLFFTGQAAMFPLGSWEIEVVRGMNPDLDFGFFPMPSATGGDPTITSWVDGSFGINANSEHKEEAKKFLEFLTTKEFGDLFTKEFKMISANPEVQSDDELVNSLSEAVNQYSTPYMMLVHFAGGNPTTKVTIETELQGMYIGDQTVDGVVEKVQESAESWFEPFK